MKNIIKKISWLQHRPNVLAEDVDAADFAKTEKKTIKKRGRKSGIGCPDCPK